MIRFLLLGCCFVAYVSCAQFNPVKKAQAKFERKHWKEGRTLLNKALRKDSLQISVYYTYSKLFMNPRFPEAKPDTAYAFALRALHLWNKSSLREQAHARKFMIDSTRLSHWVFQIDSTAFAQAKEQGTEFAYQQFLTVYYRSPNTALAIELRDEAAFVQALKLNSYQAFQAFLQKYPKSHRAAEAQKRYDQLWFAHQTRGNSTIEYKQFVDDYPTSPHVPEAIEKIFDAETLDGEHQSFEKFIQAYPQSPQARIAQTITNYLPKVETQVDEPIALSLQQPWLPIHQEHGWGFVTLNGSVMLTGLPSVQEAALCTPWQTDNLITEEGVITRNGETLLSGKFENVIDLGAGFLWIDASHKGQVFHKSGLLEPITALTQALVIQNRFLALNRGDAWALYSLTGIPLTAFTFQSIETVSRFVLFRRSGKTLLVPLPEVLNFSKGTYQPIVADEIKPMGNLFWLRNGYLEQVIDQNLQTVLPFDRHQISFGALGLMVKHGGTIALPQWPLAKEKLLTVTIAEPWAVLRSAGEKPTLHHIPSGKIIEPQADSIWFEQSLVFTRLRDSIRMRLPNLQTITFAKNENVQVRLAKDSTLFLLVKTKQITRVINARTLREVFRTEHTPEPILQNIFLFEKKGKKGLLDNTGKIILQPVYDAIVYNQTTLSLLKDNLFGAFRLASKKIIKQQFESNLRPIGDNYFAVKKKTGWGFISDAGQPISKFVYDNIQPWSDTLAIVEQANQKMLLNIHTQHVTLDSLDGITPVESTLGAVGLVQRNGLYGMINSQGKLLLPTHFEELTTTDTDAEKIVLAIEPINETRKQVSYRKLNGTIIFTFQTSPEIALKLLCD